MTYRPKHMSCTYKPNVSVQIKQHHYSKIKSPITHRVIYLVNTLTYERMFLEDLLGGTRTLISNFLFGSERK